MLIAVASRSGKEIDQHFGRADRFYVFRVTGDDVILEAERPVTEYCRGSAGATPGQVPAGLADALQGCRAVVSAQIGECPRAQLEQLGIEAFVAHGPIRDTLRELARVL